MPSTSSPGRSMPEIVSITVEVFDDNGGWSFRLLRDGEPWPDLDPFGPFDSFEEADKAADKFLEWWDSQVPSISEH
jgi:hypothetical protein